MYKLLLENTRLHADENIGIINQEILDLEPVALNVDLKETNPLLCKKIFKHLNILLSQRFPNREVITIDETYRYPKPAPGFIPYHTFIVAYSTLPAMYTKRNSKTSFNYQYGQDFVAFSFTPRLLPVEPLTFVMASTKNALGEKEDYVLNGNGLLRRIWKQRFVEDQKLVWDLSSPTIAKSINNAVTTIYHDIMMFVHRPFDKLLPHELYYISTNIIENLLHLMTLVGVYNNIEEYRLLKLERPQLMEFFQLSHDNFFNDPYALNFIHASMQICGKWIEHMLKNDYNHLMTQLRKNK